MSAQEKLNRRILYGRRQGHALTAGAQFLLGDALSRFGLDLGVLQAPEQIFPRATGLALEVGFGGAEHLIALASARPDWGFIGCEPFVNGVAKAARAIALSGLTNVRLHPDDARDVLERLPAASLDLVCVLFPDPWPKTRHHKRRFIQQDTLREIARLLKPGGRFRVASDIADYVRWTLIEIARFNRPTASFTWTAKSADDWRVRPAGWPPTRYEAKAIAAGRKPAFLEFRRESLSLLEPAHAPK